MKPEAPDVMRAIHLSDDGLIPNSPLPLLVYQQALTDPANRAAAFEKLFADNGWHRGWRNGIYSFRHYHSTAHEVLGVAQGSVRVEFGGPDGESLDLVVGDAVLIPAGVSHCNLGASDDLLIIGAYPDGGQMEDLCRDTEADRLGALPRLPRVARPASDPVVGAGGLQSLWGDA